MIKSLKEMIESLNIVMENLLLDVTSAKSTYRNFFIFLNESVIRCSKHTSSASNTEIENTKNHLAKLVSNKEQLLKLCATKATFYMDHISAYFDPKLDEQLKGKAVNYRLLHDTVTGIVYRKELGAGESRGGWDKEQLPLPRSTQFVTQYKPVSGIKTIMSSIKHLFDCIHCNPMKVFSRYIVLDKCLSFADTTSKPKIWDAVAVYSDNVRYSLLIHFPLPKGKERVGVLRRIKNGKWSGKIKKLPAGLTCIEAKFHGAKDLVCLLQGQGKTVLVAFSLSEFAEGCVEVDKFGDALQLAGEEVKLERSIELTEGKKEKLRCGCRGYICLVGDERKLEVYEITDS
eukprot:TRINITY_DN2799_c0_g2_i1.p1 TRINITY_DN2799_c0_g2~~TRINITY_DN2799_c0_g2_i1.p1  ORF type:complete len:344 (-),score=92.45 TRINITY_DN2799_c0_g2_i1:52-1083(-)